MILGIGIDSVEIDRFVSWSTFSKEKLLKIFSEHEIEYCLENSIKSPERFAARFAVREAFFKAFCQMAPDNKIPFLTLCKMISVESAQKGAPQLFVDWPNLHKKSEVKLDQEPRCCFSITHTNSHATVLVVIED